MQRIDRDAVLRLMDEGAQIVEVLERRQYEWVHLPGAVHHFLPTLEDAARERLDPDRPVVVYCSGHL